MLGKRMKLISEALYNTLTEQHPDREIELTRKKQETLTDKNIPDDLRQIMYEYYNKQIRSKRDYDSKQPMLVQHVGQPVTPRVAKPLVQPSAQPLAQSTPQPVPLALSYYQSTPLSQSIPWSHSTAQPLAHSSAQPSSSQSYYHSTPLAQPFLPSSPQLSISDDDDLIRFSPSTPPSGQQSKKQLQRIKFLSNIGIKPDSQTGNVVINKERIQDVQFDEVLNSLAHVKNLIQTRRANPEFSKVVNALQQTDSPIPKYLFPRGVIQTIEGRRGGYQFRPRVLHGKGMRKLKSIWKTM